MCGPVPNDPRGFGTAALECVCVCMCVVPSLCMFMHNAFVCAFTLNSPCSSSVQLRGRKCRLLLFTPPRPPDGFFSFFFLLLLPFSPPPPAHPDKFLMANQVEYWTSRDLSHTAETSEVAEGGADKSIFRELLRGCISGRAEAAHKQRRYAKSKRKEKNKTKTKTKETKERELRAQRDIKTETGSGDI